MQSPNSIKAPLSPVLLFSSQWRKPHFFQLLQFIISPLQLPNATSSIPQTRGYCRQARAAPAAGNPRRCDMVAASPQSSPLGQRVLLHGCVRAEAMLCEEVLAVFPNELVYALPPPLGMSVAVTLQNQRPGKQTGCWSHVHLIGLLLAVYTCW